MRRLDAMESKPNYYPHPGVQSQQRQPLLSPAVPQPGTQTQFRWAVPFPGHKHRLSDWIKLVQKTNKRNEHNPKKSNPTRKEKTFENRYVECAPRID